MVQLDVHLVLDSLSVRRKNLQLAIDALGVKVEPRSVANASHEFSLMLQIECFVFPVVHRIVIIVEIDVDSLEASYCGDLSVIAEYIHTDVEIRYVPCENLDQPGHWPFESAANP